MNEQATLPLDYSGARTVDLGERELARVLDARANGAKLRKRDLILLVLAEADGAWVNGVSFLGGHNSEGVFVSSYSQRIGELIQDGVPIQRKIGKNGMAEYRLVR